MCIAYIDNYNIYGCYSIIVHVEKLMIFINIK